MDLRASPLDPPTFWPWAGGAGDAPDPPPMNPDERRAETLLPGGQTPEPAKDFVPSPPDPTAEISLPLDLGTIQVDQVLAKGGMGMTFLGKPAKNSDLRVVVKIPLTPETHLLDRFKNEVRILSQLDHPNIVRFVDAGESDIPFSAGTRKVPWLAMEFRHAEHQQRRGAQPQLQRHSRNLCLEGRRH
jgi:serine/threonine protein kinase